MLRRGGVVCPDFEDRFQPSDPSRPTLLLTEWQSEATVPLAAQPVREFQGRLSEFAEHLQELADISLKPPANYGEVNVRAKKYRDYLTPIKPPVREKGEKAEEGEEV